MTRRVVDIHGHYVFGVDDGARSMKMSLEMIKSAYDQGVRDIFCTSHDGMGFYEYKRNLMLLRKCLENKGIEVGLHAGNEIVCQAVCLDEVIGGITDGLILKMGSSHYVLMEFASWITGEEIVECVESLRSEAGIEPIIAHIERYRWVHDDEPFISDIRKMKIPVQINAYSLVEEDDEDVRGFARRLLAEGLVTFIGSDAHRTDHRPPMLTSGIEYIYETCDEEYAADVCYRNAERLLLEKGLR